MANLDALLVLLAGLGFLGLYIKEDPEINLVQKYLFLFAGIVLVALSFSSGQALTSSTINPINSTISYIYTPDNSLSGIGKGIGVIWVVLIFLLVWKLIQAINGQKGGKNER